MKKTKRTSAVILVIFLVAMCWLLSGCGGSYSANDTGNAMDAETSSRLNELNLNAIGNVSVDDYADANGTITLRINEINLACAAYPTREEANEHIFTCYADSSCLPIGAVMDNFNKSVGQEVQIKGYGINCLCATWDEQYYCYATVIVKPLPEAGASAEDADPEAGASANEDGDEEAGETDGATSEDSNAESTGETDSPTDPSSTEAAEASGETTTSTDPVLDEKVEALIKTLDFQGIDGIEELCRQDLSDLLSGDWNGVSRNNQSGSYRLIRSCYGREYSCQISSAGATYQFSTIKVNVDYVGELKLLTTFYSDNDFSLAMSDDGLFEQWSNLEKLNSWQLSLSDGEKITNTMDVRDPANQVAVVYTEGPDSEFHIYNLMGDGSVEKI